MIYVLDRKFKVRSTFSNNSAPGACPYYDDLLKESLSLGAATYEVTVPADHPATEALIEGGFLVRKDLDNVLVMFQIMRIEESHADIREIRIYAETAGLELGRDIVRPVQKMSAVQATVPLEYILRDSNWERGSIDYLGIANIEFTEYENALAALQRVAEAYDGELRFRVKMKNGQVIGRYVDLFERRGKDTKKRFEYSKDIQEIIKTQSIEDLITAVIPLGKGDKSGSPLTIKNVVWEKPTHAVNKPKDQDWLGIDSALERWGLEGKHIFGTYQNDTEDANVLIERGYKHLLANCNPKITYELTVSLLERLTSSGSNSTFAGSEKTLSQGYEHEAVRIGDTVHVIDRSFDPPLYLEARVIELNTSFSDPQADECVLGNFKPKASNMNFKALEAKLIQKDAQWSDIVEDYVSDNPPPAPVINQFWVHTGVTPNQRYRWDGDAWIPASIDAGYVDEKVAYKTEMHSTNGVTFKNGIISTTLFVKVWKGKEDVTAQMPASAFIWRKIDKDGVIDTTWTNAHAGAGDRVLVTAADLFQRSSFYCDLKI